MGAEYACDVCARPLLLGQGIRRGDDALCYACDRWARSGGELADACSPEYAPPWAKPLAPAR